MSKKGKQIKVTVVIDVIVDERKWIDLMESHGVNSNVILPAYLYKYVKALVARKFYELGFPQDQL